MLSLINVTFLLVSFSWFKADDLILLGHVHPAYSPSFIRSLGSSPLLPFVFFVPLSHVHTFHKCSYTSIHTLKKHTNTHTHSVSTQPPWIRSHSHRLPGTLSFLAYGSYGETLFAPFYTVLQLRPFKPITWFYTEQSLTPITHLKCHLMLAANYRSCHFLSRYKGGMWDIQQIRQQFCLVMYLHSSSFFFSWTALHFAYWTHWQECALRGSMQEMPFSPGQYEHFRAMHSVMEICPSILSLFCGLRVRGLPPFERRAWDWYVQILEGTLHFWSRVVRCRYESKTNTNKAVLNSFVCVLCSWSLCTGCNSKPALYFFFTISWNIFTLGLLQQFF